MGASIASSDRTGESRRLGAGEIWMDGTGHALTTAEAAAAMGVASCTARHLFDVAGPAAGRRNPGNGRREFSPAWVLAQVQRRELQVRASRSGLLSVAEAAAQLAVSKNTVRRWFDRDQPASGQVVPGGRTGGVERRCDPAWIRQLKVALGRPDAPTE